MEAVGPERPFAPPMQVVVLTHFAVDVMQRFGNLGAAPVAIGNQNVDVIRGNDIGQNRDVETSDSLEEILPIHVAVLGEPEEEPALVAAVGCVAAGMVVPVPSSSRHDEKPQNLKIVFSPSDFRCGLG